MREMNDSGFEWIKQIPTGWSTTRGKNILQLMKRPPEADDEVITCFRDGEVTLRRNRREDGFTFSDKEIGYQGIKKGDLVIHGMDGFAGAIGISDSDGKGSPVLVVCTTKENTRYLMYYLRTLAMQDVFLALATGIRERSCDLRWNKIADLLFPVPELNEQCRIADYLDRKCSQIDAIIARQQEVIEKLKAYKLSVITEAVTKGLNPHVPMKDSGVEWIGEIPEHWEARKLKSIVEIISKGTTPSTIGSELLSYGEIRFLKAENIQNNRVVLEPEFYIDYETHNVLKRSQLQANDVLFVIAGATIGKTAILSTDTIPANTNQAVSFIRLKEKEDSKYVWYYLQSSYVKTILNLLSVQSAQPNLSMEDMGNFCLCYPSKEERNLITEYLDKKCGAIESSIEYKQRVIELLTAYKKSLIYEVVTGKKEV